MKKMKFPRIYLRNNPNNPATYKQLDYIKGLLKDYTIVNHEYVHDYYSDMLDVENASLLIKLLKDQKPFRIINKDYVNSEAVFNTKIED